MGTETKGTKNKVNKSDALIAKLTSKIVQANKSSNKFAEDKNVNKPRAGKEKEFKKAKERVRELVKMRAKAKSFNAKNQGKAFNESQRNKGK